MVTAVEVGVKVGLGTWGGVKVGSGVGAPVEVGKAANVACILASLSLRSGVGATRPEGMEVGASGKLVEQASVISISKGIENKYGVMLLTLDKFFIFYISNSTL